MLTTQWCSCQQTSTFLNLKVLFIPLFKTDQNLSGLNMDYHSEV